MIPREGVESGPKEIKEVEIEEGERAEISVVNAEAEVIPREGVESWNLLRRRWEAKSDPERGS